MDADPVAARQIIVINVPFATVPGSQQRVEGCPAAGIEGDREVLTWSAGKAGEPGAGSRSRLVDLYRISGLSRRGRAG